MPPINRHAFTRSLPALLGSVLALGCSQTKVSAGAPENGQTRSEIHPFDLLARGADDNGFALNPEFGVNFRNRCDVPPHPPAMADPTSCSWRFNEGGDPDAEKVRPACNEHPIDPILADNVGTLLSFTCSDSPLHYGGHLNWGTAYGGAVTFEGVLTWEAYSGSGPFGDFDYNFVLQLPGESDGAQPRDPIAPGHAALGLEIDSRETAGFGSQWWASLRQITRACPERAGQFVGAAQAIAIGVLGADAEHMSASELKLELHPIYAMALRTCDPQGSGQKRNSNGNLCRPDASFALPACELGHETWLIFGRDRADEGYCSPRASLFNFFSPERKQIALKPPHRALVLRLPWTCAEEPRFNEAGSHVYTQGTPPGAVQTKPQSPEIQVTIELPEGAIVDGELDFQAAGPCTKIAARASLRRNVEARVSREGAGGFHDEVRHEPHESIDHAKERIEEARRQHPAQFEKYTRFLGQPPENRSPAKTSWQRDSLPARRMTMPCKELRVPEELPPAPPPVVSRASPQLSEHVPPAQAGGVASVPSRVPAAVKKRTKQDYCDDELEKAATKQEKVAVKQFCAVAPE